MRKKRESHDERKPLGAAEDLLTNFHGVAKVVELDGDEVGYLLGKVAEVRQQR